MVDAVYKANCRDEGKESLCEGAAIRSKDATCDRLDKRHQPGAFRS